MKRKLFTLLLAFCLVATMMPAMTVSAFADEITSTSVDIHAVAGTKLSDTVVYQSSFDFRLNLEGVYYQNGSDWEKNTDTNAVYAAGNTYRVNMIFTAETEDNFKGGSLQGISYPTACAVKIQLNGKDYTTLIGAQNGKIAYGQDGNLVMEYVGGQKNVMLVRAFITIPEVPVEMVVMDTQNVTLEVGQKYQLTASVSPYNATNKAIKWASANTSIATVSSSGVVTGRKAGITYITVTRAGKKPDRTGNVAYDDVCEVKVIAKQEQPTTPTTPEQPTTPTTPEQPTTPTTPEQPTIPTTGIIDPETGKAVDTTFNGQDIELSYTVGTYSGKDKEPGIFIQDAAGNDLVEDEDYTVEYYNNRYVGKATVIIKGMSKYAGVTAGATFTIKPKAVTVKSVKKTASRKLTVKWASHKTQTTGFQIRYATTKTFKSGTYKTVTISSKSSTSKALTKLKAGKTYYVKVRAYKIVDGKKIYSSWSKVKYAKA